ncbi:Oidioi.mRNA.OKI2018_I69.XSR.g16342.t1.cds [Oikopleura dioica]|uniref:Oidioi.mRNA.OKI2018_I69.XSR.g16342.t1.cds n=1 Tax=Oikopleura dioica TaxID=34765 RepID=A0ABN7SFS9_OIKDI|nr:Oidioi.mRNA.OKI2018_I69.XSR.g16342.t1.cds [Oikopleura dioica]
MSKNQKACRMRVNDSIVETSMLDTSNEEKENETRDRFETRKASTLKKLIMDVECFCERRTLRRFSSRWFQSFQIAGLGESTAWKRLKFSESDTPSEGYVPQTWDEFERSPQKTAKKVTFAEKLPTITKFGDSLKAKPKKKKKYPGFVSTEI